MKYSGEPLMLAKVLQKTKSCHHHKGIAKLKTYWQHKGHGTVITTENIGSCLIHGMFEMIG